MIPKSALEALKRILKLIDEHKKYTDNGVAAASQVNLGAVVLQSESALRSLLEPTEARAEVPEVTHYQGSRVKCTPHMFPIIDLESHSDDGFDYYLVRSEVKSASPLPKAETQAKGESIVKEHVWDRDGERCINCGTKDWMPGEGCFPLAALADKPVAWGIFGLFPKSGGWCLQAGQVYTDQASANAIYLSEYENSSTFMVQSLYTHPSTQPEAATIDAEAAAKEIWEAGTRLNSASDIASIIRKHASSHAGEQGWVMVPEKLTARMREAMSSAMNDVFGSYPAYDDQRQDIWSAILAAAPDSAGKK